MRLLGPEPICTPLQKSVRGDTLDDAQTSTQELESRASWPKTRSQMITVCGFIFATCSALSVMPHFFLYAFAEGTSCSGYNNAKEDQSNESHQHAYNSRDDGRRYDIAVAYG